MHTNIVVADDNTIEDLELYRSEEDLISFVCQIIKEILCPSFVLYKANKISILFSFHS